AEICTDLGRSTLTLNQFGFKQFESGFPLGRRRDASGAEQAVEIRLHCAVQVQGNGLASDNRIRRASLPVLADCTGVPALEYLELTLLQSIEHERQVLFDDAHLKRAKGFQGVVRKDLFGRHSTKDKQSSAGIGECSSECVEFPIYLLCCNCLATRLGFDRGHQRWWRRCRRPDIVERNVQ